MPAEFPMAAARANRDAQPHGTGAHISVIVPALDEEPSLPGLFASLAGLGSERPEEVLVVDGGSSDRTRRIAEQHGARVLDSPRGRGQQLARGAREASGDLLLFLHADTRLGPGALGAIRRAFEDPALGFAGLRQRIENQRGIYRSIERAANGRAARGMVYGDSGLCIRRAVYLESGGFREIPLFEDLEFSRRLRRRFPWRLIEEAEIVISARRWEREGVLRCTVRNWILTLLFRAGVAPQRLVRYYRPQSGS